MQRIDSHVFAVAAGIVGCSVLLIILINTGCLATGVKTDSANPVRMNVLDISLPAWVSLPEDVSSG